jgi:hypothetical protein
MLSRVGRGTARDGLLIENFYGYRQLKRRRGLNKREKQKE